MSVDVSLTIKMNRYRNIVVSLWTKSKDGLTHNAIINAPVRLATTSYHADTSVSVSHALLRITSPQGAFHQGG